MRNLWLAALLVATSIAVAVSTGSGTAHACSCASPVSTANLVGARPHAFVGVPYARRSLANPPDPALRVVYDVEVVEAIKGTIPATVEVYTGEGGGDCGIDLDLHVEVGLVPYGFGGVASVGLCGGVVDPDELRDVRDDTLPAPTGVGPIAALVVARAGPAPLIAVDARFEPLGYVAMDGDVLNVAPCPERDLAIAVVAVGSDAFVSVIDLASLTEIEKRVIRDSTSPAEPQWPYFSSLSCTGGRGDAVMFSPSGPGPGGTLRTFTEREGLTSVDLPDVIDVVTNDGVLYALSPDALTAIAPDGTVVDTLMGFSGDVDAVAVVIDGSDAVVAVDEGVNHDGTADRLLRIPLSGGPRSAIDLERPMTRPTLTSVPGGLVVRSGFDGTTLWLRSDASVLVDESEPLWPAGDGHLTWTYFPDVITAHVDDETRTVLAFASAPRQVLAFPNGPVVARDALGARALPVVATPGSIVGGRPPTTTTTTADATSTTTSPPSTSTTDPTTTTVAPSTTVAATTTTQEADAADDDDGGGAAWAVPIGFGLVLLGIGLAVWMARRRARRLGQA